MAGQARIPTLGTDDKLLDKFLPPRLSEASLEELVEEKAGEVVADTPVPENRLPARLSPTGLADSFESRRIPALERVPVYVEGDSYGQGNQGDDESSRPAGRLQLRHRTQAPVIRAVSGTRSDEMATRVKAQWVPNTRGLVVIADGQINDVIQFADDAGAATSREAFRSTLARLTAKVIPAATGSAFVYGPGWTTGTSDGTAGRYADFSFVGDSTHLLLNVVTGSGATVEVRAPSGSVLATLNTGGYKRAFEGALKVSGLGPGAHSLRVVVTTGAVTLGGLAIPAATPPLIVWDKPGRFSSDETRAARLSLYQAAASSILSDFPTVLPVDMGGAWDYVTMIASDFTHRNQLGNAYATNRVEAVLSDHLGDNYMQGLNALAYMTADDPSYTQPVVAYIGPGAAAPAAPAAPTVSTSDTNALVAWSKPNDNGATITTYAVRYRTSPAGTWVVHPGTIAQGSTSVTVTGLTASTAYDFQVAATNGVGTSAWSATTTASTTAPVTVYAADTFSRTTLGVTETGGQAWSQNNGGTGWAPDGAMLNRSGAGVAADDCYIDDGQSNGTIQVTRRVTPGSIGIVFRASGTNNVNGYIFWSNGTTWTLSKRTAVNTYTALGTGPGTPTSGDVMKVVMNGSSIKCYVNGTLTIEATDASFAGTRHGLWANVNNAASFDDFSHTSNVA